MEMFWSGFVKTSNVRTLGKIYSAFRSDPKRLKLYNDLVRQAKNYANTTRVLERTAHQFHQLGRGSIEAVENADRNRRLAHNSFMSHLTSVIRNAASKGVNPQPMAPYLADRHRAGEFALDIAKRFRTVGENR